MCGIIAIVRRRAGRTPPSGAELADLVAAARRALPPLDHPDPAPALDEVAHHLGRADRLMRGEAGLRALLADPGLVVALRDATATVTAHLRRLEAHLDAAGDAVAHLEATNAALIGAKDAAWAIERDRLRTAAAVADLAGPYPGTAAIAAHLSIQQALSALDRLEVRGRDSAGVHLLVRGHGLDLSAPDVAALVRDRADDHLFTSGAVRVRDGVLGLVYKTAAEIGELGDNTAALRAAIRSDPLLARALRSERAEVLVLGHTRWASVGIISEPNAHPVDSTEVGGSDLPYVTAVLNGDVDNYAELIAALGLGIAGEITTDAKVIPTLVARGVAAGLDLDEAFRRAVSQFEGSVAVGLSTSLAPEDLWVALRGSGQGMYVGLAEDAFVVASEPYGVVEDAEVHLRLDGETPADPANPAASQGQWVRLSGARAGERSGVERRSYDGTPLPVAPEEWQRPAVTTRDIDRGDHPHFLLKEISESPESFRKTLRGKLVDSGEGLAVRLPAETIPASLAGRIRAGGLRRVLVIGQGTAAVAGEAVAAAIGGSLDGSGVMVRALTATELSGFGLDADLSDALVVAISQSGTTTDTNRTVDLVRARGGHVVAIVNRRGSDLVDKADGVLFTSDGRDIEMSVASTKAFYAQIAAGFLLAEGLAQLVPGVRVPAAEHQAVLSSLRSLPDAMARCLDLRPQIAAVAGRLAPSRRYWAIVGNGPNLVAAREVRIKLSELCYKSIACDVTEDKKHIDLSSEPLILVCAAGLSGSTADDVAKEVAIFRAHKAAPVVVATEGQPRFGAAVDVLAVPEVHPRLAFVLSAMVGHLFGYEAALAIDATALPLRECRAEIEHRITAGPVNDWFAELGRAMAGPASRFADGLRAGTYDGHLDASTAVRIAALLRYATGVAPLDAYQLEMGRVGTPGVVVEDLAAALTAGIEALIRPVDAIKHQAKTVTVGISRSDETLLQVSLVRHVLAAGAPRDGLSYRSLRTLAALDPAIAGVEGHTRYRVDLDPDGTGRIGVVDRGGVALGLVSRTDRDPTLRGTKRRVAVEQEPFVTVGSDGRLVLIVPELKDATTVGLTLLHVAAVPALAATTARAVLTGYRNRYRQLVDVVTETRPDFADEVLAEVPTVELLTAPISDLAARWTHR
jgi:glucosamine--fructose-6-phosphate aminotransferase (isomerizing)